MSTIRLYVQAPLAVGAAVQLDEARAHYLSRVMRRVEGDRVELFDGQSGAFGGRIASVGKRSATIELDTQLRPMPGTRSAPVLFQAVIKRPRFEWLVEKATELDVGCIVPVRTRRVSNPLGRLERLHAIAIEAAEQSGRLDVPAVIEEVPLAAIGAHRRRGVPLLVLDPTAPALAAELAGSVDGDLDLLVGPEGGLAPEDEHAIGSMETVWRGRIAPTILRAETAAVAGLAASAMFRCSGLRLAESPSVSSVESVQNPR
ncbi:MAG TPA: RsmE family RNA methyltransferase [Geminicoccus sp.]|uniref:RsmE family RNA methyltransferase n=1 Tax=Geminicoccus sp. TaxID=2024832 RepID=UPI002E2EFA21|nr:RsmE family RNA methyltransferase [Geminicoccus sp.]HEX2526122.1 RsmE family RNA methyltransferase [Geminicoccus sp.]